MKIYEIISENNDSHGLFLLKDKAEARKLELDTIARNRGINCYYNIYWRGENTRAFRHGMNRPLAT